MKPLSPTYVACLVIICLSAFMITVWSLRVEPMPVFSNLEVATKKQSFFDYLAPIIDAANESIASDRVRLLGLQSKPQNLSWWDRRFLSRLATQYDLETDPVNTHETIQTLLVRVDVIPPSLALIQAAKESAWGTSRFATQGNNLFGQQCFSFGCGFTPASRDPGKKHEVARFASVDAAVEAYLYNLNTHPRYAELRQIRATARSDNEHLSGSVLADGLLAYSERGDDYVNEVKNMIKQNHLE